MTQQLVFPVRLIWVMSRNLKTYYVCICVILHSDKIVSNPFLITRVYDEISLNCMQSYTSTCQFFIISNDVISMYHNCTRILCSYFQNCILAYYIEEKKNPDIAVMELDSVNMHIS